MLHHWLGFQDGFNIKRQHVCTIFLDIKKYFKNAIKLKSESKCGEQISNFIIKIK
jgi:hypothetical protein